MILELFLVFLEIGAVSFGGGYGMISLLHEKILSHGYLTEEGFLNMIAVAESTPGPVAVNMATFVGSTQAGFWGAAVSTFAVVLPAFLIMLLILTLMKSFLQKQPVQDALTAVRPCVVALILSTGVTMTLKALFSVSAAGDQFVFQWRAVLIFALLFAVRIFWKKKKQKAPSPICMILFSALLGIALFY